MCGNPQDIFNVIRANYHTCLWRESNEFNTHLNSDTLSGKKGVRLTLVDSIGYDVADITYELNAVISAYNKEGKSLVINQQQEGDDD